MPIEVELLLYNIKVETVREGRGSRRQCITHNLKIEK